VGGMIAGKLKIAILVLLLLLDNIDGMADKGYADRKSSEIEIDLKFDKTSYSRDDSVRATIQLRNTSKESIYLNRGFRGKDIFLEMRMVDPAGRLLVARLDKPHVEFPDAPPLAFCLYEGRVIRPLPCESLLPGKEEWMHSSDLRENYRLELPGRYSAQVQLSVMTFKGEPCSLENINRVFVLKSEEKHFFVEHPGSKKVAKKSAETPPASQSGRSLDAGAFSTDRIRPFQAAQIVPLAWVAIPEDSQLISPALTAAVAKTAGGGTSPQPSADMLVPITAADVDVRTKVTIKIRDVTSSTVIVMKVLGLEVYRNSSPLPPYTQRNDIDPTSFTLTYDHTLDPRIEFLPSQQIHVTVDNYNKKKPNVVNTNNFSFQTAAPYRDDTDGDGISDSTESLLGTDPGKKTIFVRPKKIDGAQFSYWEGFVPLFPGPRSGIADIPAFSKAGIEISVIGDPNHPYAPMRNFNYDPALDTNHPPCDIVEIVHMPQTAYCVYGHYNFGHTYFFTSSAAWYWDTKGYVPNDQTSAHYLKYGYFTPLIYPFAVENYFTEGAYPGITGNAMPVTTTNCGLNQCYETAHSSPLNVNDTNPATGRPDNSVELDNIIVLDPNKKIIYVGAIPGTGYEREMVFRRTIAHELGHALMAASENDHCSNPDCIMYGNVIDWKLSLFGETGICTHSPGGSKDIRAKGIVHNWAH
jgi:hypothetical protein